MRGTFEPGTGSAGISKQCGPLLSRGSERAFHFPGPGSMFPLYLYSLAAHTHTERVRPDGTARSRRAVSSLFENALRRIQRFRAHVSVFGPEEEADRQ